MPTIKPDFFFQNTSDPKYLVIQDLSEYGQTYSKPAIINIWTPGASNPLVYTWNKNASNWFDSNILYLGCSHGDCEEDITDLPDGIFRARLELSPNTFYKEKHYLKTDLLELELAKIGTRIGIEYDPKDDKFRQWLLDTQLQIFAAKSSVALGDMPTGKRQFDQAQKLLKQYQECKDCY